MASLTWPGHPLSSHVRLRRREAERRARPRNALYQAEVRDSHGLAPLSSVDMSVIIEERDKELFARGQRLIDQRRFDLWHLGSGAWQYFPISQEERNNNPNL